MAERAYTYGSVSYYDRYTNNSNLAYDNVKVAEQEKEILIHKNKKASILDNPKQILFVAVSLIIIGLFVIIWRTAIISSMNTQVVEMKSALGIIHSQNEQTAVLLDKTTNLSYVEDVARNKLNMDVPKTEQKIYIDVEVQDMVEIPKEYGNSFLSGAKRFVKGCMEYLY